MLDNFQEQAMKTPGQAWGQSHKEAAKEKHRWDLEEKKNPLNKGKLFIGNYQIKLIHFKIEAITC